MWFTPPLVRIAVDRWWNYVAIELRADIALQITLALTGKRNGLVLLPVRARSARENSAKEFAQSEESVQCLRQGAAVDHIEPLIWKPIHSRWRSMPRRIAAVALATFCVWITWIVAQHVPAAINDLVKLPPLTEISVVDRPSAARDQPVQIQRAAPKVPGHVGPVIRTVPE